MSKSLVVVESPAKAKTINKYLGKDFKVLASYGHVVDLLRKEGSVEPENDFFMHYHVIEKNLKHMQAIQEAMHGCDTLLLATDPDREGEAIAYHIFDLMEKAGLLKGKTVSRVAFHEITKAAVTTAISNGRELSMDLVNAQQARRALDYLVGFNLSPLLWRKIRPGLSAGRVQSPALRMVVEREKEIAAFIQEEYWTIEADLKKGKQSFEGKLIVLAGDKLKQFDINHKEQADGVISTLEKISNGKLIVTKVEKKSKKRNPAAPFTTSGLQQEAARKLGFGAKRTMRIAQQLYEGIDIGEGAQGLITYMRTDSVTLAEAALEEIKQVITARYGKESLPSEVRRYKTKSKNAQEAHEAIRPTSAAIIPEEIKQHLSTDQFKLYELIWKRTIASQMQHATINTVSVDLSADDKNDKNLFRATGSTIADPGFIQVYQEGMDDVVASDDDEKMLPELKEGESIPFKQIRGEQHFTEPPPRYSEATLVKQLEENGIGRPSTYASIIETLQQREYALLDNKRFIPTDTGTTVNKFLTTYFTKYVDYSFTAGLEDELDSIARGEKDWKPVLREFWQPFTLQVKDVLVNVQRKDVVQEDIDEKCPKCDKQLVEKLGKRGKFISCSGYPECDFTRSKGKDGESETTTPEIVEGRNCPKCESQLQIRMGRFGKFIGCTNYPKCKHIEPLQKPQDSGVVCPECNKSTLVQRKSRYGKFFYSCGCYPDCKYAVWEKPIALPCPQCNWPLLIIKTTKRRGTELVCPQKECDFAKPYPEGAPSESTEST